MSAKFQPIFSAECRIQNNSYTSIAQLKAPVTCVHTSDAMGQIFTLTVAVGDAILLW